MLEGLAITRGYSALNIGIPGGGGLDIFGGSVTLNNCDIHHNEASGGYMTSGGLHVSGGKTTLMNSQIHSNTWLINTTHTHYSKT